MKAIVFQRHGGPEVLEYTDAPEPQIKANEILVRVRAVALNHLDLWVRRGLPGIEIPLPHIPGSDVAGEIAKVGELVTRVKVGDKVLLAPGVSCGQCAACVGGASQPKRDAIQMTTRVRVIGHQPRAGHGRQRLFRVRLALVSTTGTSTLPAGGTTTRAGPSSGRSFLCQT